MNNKVNARNKWSLSLGCIGRDMCYTLVSLFLLTYLQYTGLFTTEQFVVLTVFIVLCQVWDAVNDPMMGTIITNTKTRFGKYRPWVLIGAVSNAIVMVLLFSIRFETGSWANVVFISLMYLLWGMTFTMNDISYWDLLPALAVEKKERDSLTTLVAVFASLGAFASGGLVPILTPGNMIAAYRNYAIICAVVFLACQLLVFFGVHDNKHDKFIEPKEDQETSMKEEKVSLKGMFKILLSNKQLLVMAVVVLLYSLGSALLNAFGQNFFYFKFGYLSSSDGQMSGGTMMFVFTIIYALGTLISQAVYPFLANKWSRNQLIFFSIIALAIGYIGFFTIANLLSGMVCFIILCILGVAIFIGQGVFYLVMLVMLTNTIEYGEWQTGKNNAAITFTIRPFMVKLASAIQYGVVAITLIVCGLYRITSDVGVIEVAIGMIGENATKLDVMKYLADNGQNIALLGVTPEAMTEELRVYASSLFDCNAAQMLGLTAAMTVVPIILFIVAYFVCKKRYIITEEFYEKITKEIAERNTSVEAKQE